MASTQLEEIIKQAEKLSLDEQLYLIARLADKARTANGTAKVAQPLVGEELAALLDRIDALPYTPHPDGRTDISSRHEDILYPKTGDVP